MKARLLIIVGLTAVFSSWALALHAQCTGVCKGDFDGDNHVTIEEIIAAVNSALNGCGDAARQGCIDSGGQVMNGLCCSGVDDFPSSCAIGLCGCAPQFSSPTQLCDCGDGRCFNGSACVDFSATVDR